MGGRRQTMIGVFIQQGVFTLGDWDTAAVLSLILIGIAIVLLSGMLAGTLFAFMVSFDEIVTTLFLTGPGATTMPFKIWLSIRFSINPTIAAVSTMVAKVRDHAARRRAVPVPEPAPRARSAPPQIEASMHPASG
jgi:ABC-type spermidine/putrescine transport system permease subunit I